MEPRTRTIPTRRLFVPTKYFVRVSNYKTHSHIHYRTTLLFLLKRVIDTARTGWLSVRDEMEKFAVCEEQNQSNVVVLAPKTPTKENEKTTQGQDSIAERESTQTNKQTNILRFDQSNLKKA